MSGFGTSPRLYQYETVVILAPLGWSEVTMGLTLPRFAESVSRPLLAGLVSLACAIAPNAAGPNPKVWVRSHNASEVDIYLLCGNRNAKWLGLVPVKGAAAFELAAEETYCPWGLNFFLVVRGQGRGYWAGPLRPRGSAAIELVIEKYAGLSAARLLGY
jgi:hypothetical protein